MVYIKIITSTDDEQEMAELLKEIARLIETGCSSGYHPTWNLEIEEDINDD
jgi:hypothetical protein